MSGRLAKAFIVFFFKLDVKVLTTHDFTVLKRWREVKQTDREEGREGDD